MSRCTGHCCRAFTIPATPDELSHQADLHAGRRESCPRGARTFEDGPYIADMLIYLGWKGDTVTVEVATETGDTREEVRTVRVDYYACRHFDAAAGSCRAYETRPAMCRDFPYRGEPCPWPGCTYVPDENEA